MATKIFVNLPVKDLNKPIEFFTKRSFQDIDGHLWEVLYMDINALNQNQNQ